MAFQYGTAVATVLTVYGIETYLRLKLLHPKNVIWLQQYLPFTVLKLLLASVMLKLLFLVATVLTVYGIETDNYYDEYQMADIVATVLTVYGIETSVILFG